MSLYITFCRYDLLRKLNHLIIWHFIRVSYTAAEVPKLRVAKNVHVKITNWKIIHLYLKLWRRFDKNEIQHFLQYITLRSPHPNFFMKSRNVIRPLFAFFFTEQIIQHYYYMCKFLLLNYIVNIVIIPVFLTKKKIKIWFGWIT